MTDWKKFENYVSYSAISMYYYCPYQYYLKYVLKEKADEKILERKYGRGSRTHNGIEHIMKGGDIKEVEATESEIRMINQFTDAVVKVGADSRENELAESEKEIYIPLANPETGEVEFEKNLLAFIDINTPEKWVEIKTGKKWSLTKIKNHMQFKIYALGLYLETGEVRSGLLMVLDYSTEKIQIEKINITMNDIVEAYNWIKKAIDGINKFEFDDHCKNCYMCEFKHLCPYS